jgi:signal transduction histidine kinase
MCVVAAVVTTTGSTSEYDWLEGLARAVMVGAPLAVGLYARRRQPFERFGTMLIAVGVAWFVATFSGSRDEVLYSVGRIAAWFLEVALVYVVLAFPSGRLPGRPDRLLAGAAAFVVMVLYLPTALLVEAYPLPAPPTSCHTDCPHNAFMIVSAEPAFVSDIVRPLREFLTAALFTAVTVRLGVRIHRATHLVRRTLEPVLLVAILRLAFLAVGTTARRVAPESQLLDICMWLIAFTLPAMAVAFLVGLGRWRLFTAAAMQRLATRLHGHPRPDELRAALADAFDDPSLDIAYWLDDGGGRWVDAEGKAVRPPPAGSGRCLTEVRDDDRRVAAIIHDAALRDDPAFIAVATSYSVMTLDHQRLSLQAATLVGEVHDSRARIQATADEERRRIERDIHDGAQQRLVALRQSRARGRADRGRRPRPRESPARARNGCGHGHRRGPVAGTRHLPRRPRGPRPGRRTALGRTAVRPPDYRARRRSPALPPRDRDRRLLLLSRGATERRQTRPRRDRDGS